MTIIVELAPEVEAEVAAMAAARGVGVTEYVLSLLEDQARSFARAGLLAKERATAWRDSVKDLPDTPPLLLEAISRESLYDARG